MSSRDRLAAAMLEILVGRTVIDPLTPLEYALADAAIEHAAAEGVDLFEVQHPGADAPRIVTSWLAEAQSERDRTSTVVKRRWAPVPQVDSAEHAPHHALAGRA